MSEQFHDSRTGPSNRSNVALCCSHPPCWSPTSSLATTLESVLDSTCNTTTQVYPIGGSSDHSTRAPGRANIAPILVNEQPSVSTNTSSVKSSASSNESHRETRPSTQLYNVDPLDLEIVSLLDSIVDSISGSDECTNKPSTRSTTESTNDSIVEPDIVTMLETYLTSNIEPSLTLDLQPYFDSLFTPMFTPP